MSTGRTSERTAGGRSLSAWPLRRKVALALAIPLLLAATLGGLRVGNDLTEARNSSASAQQVTVLGPAIDYLTAASRAMVAAQSSTEASRSDLDAAVKDLEAAAGDLAETRDSAGLTAEQSHQVDVVLDLSRALREDTGTLSPGTWVAQLRQLQSGTTQLITTIVNAQRDPEPRLELLAQTLAGRFSLAMQQALVATERSGDTGSLELFAELGVEGAAIDRLASAMGGVEPAVLGLRTANAERTRTVRTGGTDLGGNGAYAEYDGLVDKLMAGIDRSLAASATDARSSALVNGAITLAALLTAIVLALLISRSILNPIRRVREGALSVAHERLPAAVARIRGGAEPDPIEPIDVSTTEEVGQLARAVDDMHRQAVLLAAGEAELRSQVSEMFVTLSRRNTSLVNQQLGLIEKLEKDEEDPRRLESLFRLDHLAARMRRTADSLLILADAPGAAGAADGLTVSDAMQAATAGVQDYQRVRIGTTSPLHISDAAAADVIHLLTELVDNALTYSPPDTAVSISAVTSADGVTIEVADEGLGLPADTLATINQTLRSGGDVTPDTARRMGLFVVSRLAKRHGLTASLRLNEASHEGSNGTAPARGVTATVVLPVAVLPELAPVKPAPVGAGPVEAPVDAPVDATVDATVEAPVKAPVKPTPAIKVTKPARPAKPAKTAKAAKTVKAAKPSKAAEPAPSAEAAPAAKAPSSVEERINSALGLPTRRPGATVDRPGLPPKPSKPTTPAPALARREPASNGATPASNGATPASNGATPASNGATPASNGATPARPEPTPVSTPAPTPTFDAPAAAQGTPQPVVPEPAAAQPPPEPAVPTTTPSSAPSLLDADWQMPEGEEDDSPIFRSLRSAWLSSDGGVQSWTTSEVEAGWERADEVAQTPEPVVTDSGLPVRQPGTRLVPGGVTRQATTTARDPEAVRARLAAHAAGVSRGRTAAASTDRQTTEAGPA